MRLPWLAQSEQKVRFAFSICRFWLEKAVALGAVIGTNLHGEGSRALRKRTAISFSSSFALGWGHLWALMKIWTTPPFYRKKICPDLMFHTNQMKMHLLFSVCFGVVFFSVCVFHCMSVWQGGLFVFVWVFWGLGFLSMNHQLSQIGLWALSARGRWHLDPKESWNPWSSSQGADPETS